MLPIKFNNGVASLNINAKRKLSPRQLATLQRTEMRLGERAAAEYLYSLLGLSKKPVQIAREQASRMSRDTLASKPAGTILHKFKSLLYNEDDADHRPSQRGIGQWIGVEIECFYPSSRECNDDCDHDNGECNGDYSPSEREAHKRIREAVAEAGIPRVSVKYDGSLDAEDDGVGVEVTLLFNSEDGFRPLEKLCGVLNRLGCFVNDTCGLHVHLDARHLKPKGAKLIGRRLGRALPVLKYLVAPARHDNHYCKMWVSPFTSNSEERYAAVNMTAFFRFKTIEVRLHGGSTNPKKIRNWIELLRFIASTRIPKQFTTFQQLIDIGTPEHLVEYADKRINRLNPGAWPQLMPETAPQAAETGGEG